MASIVDDTKPIVPPYRLPHAWAAWLVRRRIAISLVGFTALVAYNVLVRQTIPFNPFSAEHPEVCLAWGLLSLGLGIRTWAAGTLDKSRRLVTAGPYALCRNPLYVGSFLMMIAFCIFSHDWPALLFVCGPMALVYWVQIRHEEIFLNTLFPDQWPDYAATVPRLVPRPTLPRHLASGWSLGEWKRNREYRAVVASGLGVAAIFGWFLLRTAM